MTFLAGETYIIGINDNAIKFAQLTYRSKLQWSLRRTNIHHDIY